MHQQLAARQPYYTQTLYPGWTTQTLQLWVGILWTGGRRSIIHNSCHFSLNPQPKDLTFLWICNLLENCNFSFCQKVDFFLIPIPFLFPSLSPLFLIYIILFFCLNFMSVNVTILLTITQPEEIAIRLSSQKFVWLLEVVPFSGKTWLHLNIIRNDGKCFMVFIHFLKIVLYLKTLNYMRYIKCINSCISHVIIRYCLSFYIKDIFNMFKMVYFLYIFILFFFDSPNKTTHTHTHTEKLSYYQKMSSNYSALERWPLKKKIKAIYFKTFKLHLPRSPGLPWN